MKEMEDRKTEELIDRIMGRVSRYDCSGLGLRRNLHQAHISGLIDLERLAGFPDVHLLHDVNGIANLFDREAGKFRDCFLPRCAKGLVVAYVGTQGEVPLGDGAVLTNIEGPSESVPNGGDEPKRPKKGKWTVLLLYMADAFGHDTYCAHVRAKSAEAAVRKARKEAARADYDTPPTSTEDYYCLFCTTGWHTDHSGAL